MMDTNIMREWTNEKHVNFLNSLEASFVRAMFADGTVNNDERKLKQEQDLSSHKDCLPRLDRVLPDSCDSTEDLPTQRRRLSADNMADNNRSTVKSERKTKRILRSQPYCSLHDQVVPHAELRRRD